MQKIQPVREFSILLHFTQRITAAQPIINFVLRDQLSFGGAIHERICRQFASGIPDRRSDRAQESILRKTSFAVSSVT